MLLRSSLSPSSRRSYLRSWSLLLEFCKSYTLPFVFPCCPTLICNFVGHLHNKHHSPNSITSHISAISYIHKLCEVYDPTHSFMVRKILKGAHNLRKSFDSRLPITKAILTNLIAALQHTVANEHDRVILRAIFLLAFHGFMRLGELIPISPAQIDKVIQRSHVLFVDSASVQISLHYYKHMKNNQSMTITLSSNSQPTFCPVTALQNYLDIVPHTSGPLFTFKSGRPITHNFVSSHLKNAVQFIGLNPSHYLGHSFRIGAATEAAKLGMSETVIQRLGRWHSNAVQRYIRINAFKV